MSGWYIGRFYVRIYNVYRTQNYGIGNSNVFDFVFALIKHRGLGKTVEMLALIQQSPKGSTTLIVTQLSLLAQWEEELTSKTNLSYFVYYGDSKKKNNGTASASSLADSVNVVLTTCKLPRDRCGWLYYDRSRLFSPAFVHWIPGAAFYVCNQMEPFKLSSYPIPKNNPRKIGDQGKAKFRTIFILSPHSCWKNHGHGSFWTKLTT